MSAPKVVVHGVGMIGGLLGGALAHAGVPVTLLGRPSALAALADGLRLTDLDGRDLRVPREAVALADSPRCLAEAELVLLCVKAGAVAEAARELAAHARPGTPVVSLQNGVRSAAVLAAGAPTCRAVPGMVPFNVTQPAPGRWHRATEGALTTEPHPALTALAPALAAAGVDLAFFDDLRPVQWAKVLLNLNNPINALSGRPLLAQLGDRDFRRVLASCMAEGLAALTAAGIEPARLTRVHPRALPHLLRLPSWLYTRLARRTLKIDPDARSSMADDLARGRRTEIDELCGAVVELGQRHGVPTPRNQRMIELIRRAESGDPRRYDGAALRALVEA